MPMSRRYQTPEVRLMLQTAEHKPSPVTGVGAHSRTLHAGATPGGLGATPTNMMDRTHKRTGESNKQFSKRGGAARTSSFKNQLQQADAVCQALNSIKGQQALRQLDAVSHAGKNLRVTIQHGPIVEAGFLPGSTVAKMSTVHKSQASVQRPAGGTAGIRLIIDRGAGQKSFHIQTCMPLDALPASSFEVKNMDVNPGQVIVSG